MKCNSFCDVLCSPNVFSVSSKALEARAACIVVVKRNLGEMTGPPYERSWDGVERKKKVRGYKLDPRINNSGQK